MHACVTVTFDETCGVFEEGRRGEIGRERGREGGREGGRKGGGRRGNGRERKGKELEE